MNSNKKGDQLENSNNGTSPGNHYSVLTCRNHLVTTTFSIVCYYIT
jgi:hypothetical protein